jgi:hypothetical protein
MPKLLTRPWSDEDVEQLKILLKKGSTLLRAAAALRRSNMSVQRKARALGLKFPGVRAVRAGLRETGAIKSGRRPGSSE